ncbi:MAG: hypothetical protein RBU37_22650 [Myxococcota bacterium]|jgi:hypothetical protein|nr:hypothetical protein [Myxococcota bacterium]
MRAKSVVPVSFFLSIGSLACFLSLFVFWGCNSTEKAVEKKVEQAQATRSAAMSTEGKQNLGLIASGARTYYSDEHVDRGGMEVKTGIFPPARSWVCSAGGDEREKASVGSTNWKAEPWSSLRFELREHAFQYCYRASYDQKSFAASAELGEQFFCVTGEAGPNGPNISAVRELPLDEDCELP